MWRVRYAISAIGTRRCARDRAIGARCSSAFSEEIIDGTLAIDALT
jgi:hypothetical protein